jgi:hypothetical protein
VLPAGTTVDPSAVYIQEGIGPDTGSWPVLVLSIPVSDDEEFVLGPTYQTVYTCHVLYLDNLQWSGRSQEEALADAAAQLDIMRATLRGNNTLTVDGVPHCWEIRRIQRRMAQPLDKAQLGFPAIQAEMLVMVADLPETFDASP